MLSLSPKLYQDILDWYLVYAESFLLDDESRQSILLKRDHSLRVAATSGLIGKRMQMADGEVLLARIIGLLHDVARFEQYAQFRTFRDPLSFNHGDYGAEIVSELEILNSLTPSIRDVIITAVRYHNAMKIPAELKGRALLHTRLIRDSDKLDIIYLTCKGIRNGSDQHNFTGINRNGEVSSDVLESLRDNQFVDYNSLKTTHDFQLLKIGWVYDLNFPPSFALLKKRKHIEMLKETLPEVPGISSLLADIDAYLVSVQE